jgi:hypothetical protein
MKQLYLPHIIYKNFFQYYILGLNVFSHATLTVFYDLTSPDHIQRPGRETTGMHERLTIHEQFQVRDSFIFELLTSSSNFFYKTFQWNSQSY